MFRRWAEIRERLFEIVEEFRRRGAVSPDKAMTVEELGLPLEFKGMMKRRLGQLGVFVEVNGKYYLSEEGLREVKERFASRPLRRWIRHTASVPKGFLRYFVLRLLREKPMSGSEIIEEIDEETGGRWKPSPGSLYPLLAWLKDNGYTKEIPTEEIGIKCYMLTEKGEKFFQEETKLKEELQKKLEFLPPLLFWPKKLRVIREPGIRLFRALSNLRALEKNLTEQALREVAEFLDSTAEKMEEINKRLAEKLNS